MAWLRKEKLAEICLKMKLKGHLHQTYIFEWFVVDFSTILRSKMDQKSIKIQSEIEVENNAPQERSKNGVGGVWAAINQPGRPPGEG